MDKEKVEFILKKKEVITIAVIFVFLFFLLVFTDIHFNPYPPKLVFIDKESNEFLEGGVLLDNEYIGESSNGVFTNLPDDFCEKKHKITLEVNEKQYSWQSFPSDCELNYILFKAEEKRIIEVEYVTMRFFIKETQEPIKGELYFDDEFIDDTDGEYTVDKDTCNSIRVINIKTETSDIEWKHHTVWCDTYDLIEYSISEDELE